MASDYLIGTGIYDVTGPSAELGMIGFGQLDQKTEGIQSRLFARSFIVCDRASNKRVVIVSADIWSCTQAVKMEVVKRLRDQYGNDLYNVDNVLLSGTHTHSGPGGFSHYALYNLTILGFDEQNFECIVNGFTESIKRAHDNLTPGKIYVNRGEVEDCGWNRSAEAYRNNPQQEQDRYENDTDKEMLLIKFVTDEGKEIGCLNWFAIHPTNRGEKNTLISGDNKGYASYLFEKEMRSNPADQNTFVAAFANSNCGDISGNVKYGIPDGINDFAHMQEFGYRQYQKAKELSNSAQIQLKGSIDYRHAHVDMSNVHIEGSENRTYPAALGVSMFAGSTEDSHSPFAIGEGVTTTGSGDVPILAEQVILPLISLISGILEGCTLPEVLEDEFKKGHGNKPVVLAQGLSKPVPLSPEVVPIQIIRIGNLVLTGISGEITTMAGRRLKENVLNKLKDTGVDYLALATYANAYSGYITTKEEYDLQHYEGASTHFGPYTLLAYQQEFGKLAEAMRDGHEVDSGPTPRDLSDKQTTLQTGVVIDTPPLPWIPFGSVDKDVESSYKVGATVTVVFWGAHPKNNLRTQDTFLKVEKKQGNNWKTIHTGRDPCTTYHWSRDFIANSKITITWNIPEDTEPGQYRISHYGDSKDPSGKITPYQGVSSPFSVNVGENIASDQVVFENLSESSVELWFYHPDDRLRWIAYAKHTIAAEDSYSWTLPAGWDGAQIRFNERGQWHTVLGGEKVIISETGDMRKKKEYSQAIKKNTLKT